MANVLFKRVEDSTQLDNIPVVDGSFYVTGDGKSFIDYDGERLPVGGTPDTEMSDRSTNAVENKVIKQYVDTLDTKVSSQISIDTNGWTIIEHDSYIEYLKRGTYNRSMGANTWAKLSISDLPYGITNIANDFLTGSIIGNDGILNCSLGTNADSTAIQIQVYNPYSSTINATFYWNARILKLKDNV